MPETAIAKRADESLVPAEYDRRQVNLIRMQLMPNASDGELAIFLEYAKRTGLDPFAKQLVPIRTWDKDNNRYRWEFMAGIDGLRLVAQRTGEYDGFEGPLFRGKGGEWTDYWDGDEPPHECKFIVYRKGSTRGFTGRIKYAEFVRKNRKGEVYGPWLTQPEHMMRIRAESHALRSAFPRETSGLYLREDEDTGEVRPVQVKDPGSPASAAQKGELHRLASVFGWDEDEYRSRLQTATGKSSSKDLTKGEAHTTIDEWRQWETALLENGDAPPEEVIEGEIVEQGSGSEDDGEASNEPEHRSGADPGDPAGPGDHQSGDPVAPEHSSGVETVSPLSPSPSDAAPAADGGGEGAEEPSGDDPAVGDSAPNISSADIRDAFGSVKAATLAVEAMFPGRSMHSLTEGQRRALLDAHKALNAGQGVL